MKYCQHVWGVPKQVEFGVKQKELWWQVKCHCCSTSLSQPTYEALQEVMNAK